MAILKYTKADGTVVTVNSYKVNNVIVAQEKGQSTADVMSQKAVTDIAEELATEVAGKADAGNVYSKTEADGKFQLKGNYLTEHQSLAGYYTKGETDTKLADKADAATTYTKAETDSRIEAVIGTAPEALDTLGEIATALEGNSDAITAINGVLTGKANATDVYTKTETDSKLGDKANSTDVYTKAETDAMLEVFDCGTY